MGLDTLDIGPPSKRPFSGQLNHGPLFVMLGPPPLGSGITLSTAERMVILAASRGSRRLVVDYLLAGIRQKDTAQYEYSCCVLVLEIPPGTALVALIRRTQSSYHSL
eukprot:scaffold119798_cov38-Prasinocladus_malaysianus.AAC.2